MVKDILFSIITPVYKVEKYLAECVNSILSQSFSEFELILIDDGSPDSCPSICDGYAKEDVRVKVIHQVNKGVSIARQVGVEQSVGKYLIFVDSDDCLLSGALQKISNVIRKYNTDIVSYSLVDPVRRSFAIRPEVGLFSRDDIIRCIFPKLLESSSGDYFEPALYLNAIKRELYQKNAVVNKKIVIGEDLACTKACFFSANSVFFIPEALYFYRYRNDSVTVKKKAFPWDGPELIGRHLEEKIDLDVADMRSQLCRVITHQLFLVAKSQFSREESFFNISKEIKRYMGRPYYKRAIDNCHYKFFTKGTLAKMALKYKLTVLMWMFCKLGY